MFTLTISTENAAFEEDKRAECARILRKLADDMAASRIDTDDYGSVRDINGNTVGDWKLNAD